MRKWEKHHRLTVHAVSSLPMEVMFKMKNKHVLNALVFIFTLGLMHFNTILWVFLFSFFNLQSHFIHHTPKVNRRNFWVYWSFMKKVCEKCCQPCRYYIYELTSAGQTDGFWKDGTDFWTSFYNIWSIILLSVMFTKNMIFLWDIIMPGVLMLYVELFKWDEGWAGA